MRSRRGVRDDRGPGLAKGEGGMVMRGESGRAREEDATLLLETAVLSDTELMVVVPEHDDS